VSAAQVEGNGYVFGAYTHCAWPAGNGVVADPTGKSFLFSLINKTGKAVRFSLEDKERAVQLGSGISFGAGKYEDGQRTGLSNLTLMLKGAADQKDANLALIVNANKAYQPDDAALKCIGTFFEFAGEHRFSAEEIEVYQL
jgi:hypothetical protein